MWGRSNAGPTGQNVMCSGAAKFPWQRSNEGHHAATYDPDTSRSRDACSDVGTHQQRLQPGNLLFFLLRVWNSRKPSPGSLRDFPLSISSWILDPGLPTTSEHKRARQSRMKQRFEQHTCCSGDWSVGGYRVGRSSDSSPLSTKIPRNHEKNKLNWNVYPVFVRVSVNSTCTRLCGAGWRSVRAWVRKLSGFELFCLLSPLRRAVASPTATDAPPGGTAGSRCSSEHAFWAFSFLGHEHRRPGAQGATDTRCNDPQGHPMYRDPVQSDQTTPGAPGRRATRLCDRRESAFWNSVTSQLRDTCLVVQKNPSENIRFELKFHSFHFHTRKVLHHGGVQAWCKLWSESFSGDLTDWHCSAFQAGQCQAGQITSRHHGQKSYEQEVWNEIKVHFLTF